MIYNYIKIKVKIKIKYTTYDNIIYRYKYVLISLKFILL